MPGGASPATMPSKPLGLFSIIACGGTLFGLVEAPHPLASPPTLSTNSSVSVYTRNLGLLPGGPVGWIIISMWAEWVPICADPRTENTTRPMRNKSQRLSI